MIVLRVLANLAVGILMLVLGIFVVFSVIFTTGFMAHLLVDGFDAGWDFWAHIFH